MTYEDRTLIRDIILAVIAVAATGIIMQFGLVYGDSLFDAPQWPVWHPVTETDEPWLILREGV